MADLLNDYLSQHAAEFARFRDYYDLEENAVDPGLLIAAADRCIRSQGNGTPDLLSFAQGFVSAFQNTEEPHRVLADLIQRKPVAPGSIVARIHADPQLELVKKMGGDPTRIIRRVLIANNGMAAKRIIDSLRAYSQKYFGNAHAITIIAMATPEDKALGLSFIRDADIVVDVPQGASNLANYANVDLIRRVAKDYGADAVHPGWGHASEEKALAEAIEHDGIIFMGPSEPLMRAHGDKIEALLMFQELVGKDLMSQWTGSHVSIGPELNITPAQIAECCVNTVEEAVAAAKKLGFPVMIKAAGAGGGRGMKDCYTEEEVREAWDQVVNTGGGSNIFVEALAVVHENVFDLEEARHSAKEMGYRRLHLSYNGRIYPINAPEDFDKEGMATIFRESREARALDINDPTAQITLLGGGLKHIEVQIIADLEGNVVVLWPRDCSIQRKHQKVVEESAYADPAIARQLMKAAEKIASARVKEQNYSGLATVEFLVNEETGKINFLEVNTRVQVEHPVTEGVTDLNFLEIQTLISQGVPLYRIPEVRRYFKNDPKGDGPINFSVVYGMEPEGHVIALRIISEDPDNDFTAMAGGVGKISFADMRGVWGYFSLPEGGGVGTSSDAQIGHIFIHGKTREEATIKARMALDRLTVFGQIKTNIGLLKQILNHPEFTSGKVHNASLERWMTEKSIVVQKADSHLAAINSALIRAAKEFQNRKNKFLEALGRGQIPSIDLLQTAFRVTSLIDGKKYEFMAHQTGAGTVALSLMTPDPADVAAGKTPPALIEDMDLGKTVEGTVIFESDGSHTVIINSRRFLVRVNGQESAERLDINGLSAEVAFQEIDPTVLTSLSRAKINRVFTAPGDTVEMKQRLMVIEAMKEEKVIYSDRDGVVETVVSIGQTVAADGVLVRFKLPEGEVKKETPVFEGELNRITEGVNLMPPPWTNPELLETNAADLVDRVMDGYNFPNEVGLEGHFKEFLRSLSSRKAWGASFQAFVAEYRKGMPEELYNKLLTMAEGLHYQEGDSPLDWEKVSAEIRTVVQEFSSEFERRKAVFGKINFRAAFETFISSYAGQKPFETYARKLLARYLNVEGYFADRNILEPLGNLRNEHQRGTLSIESVWAIEKAHGHSVEVGKKQINESLNQKSRLLMALLEELKHKPEAIKDLHPYLEALSKFRGPAYQGLAAVARKMLMGQVEEKTAEERRDKLVRTILENKRIPDLRKLSMSSGPFFVDLVPLTYVSGDQANPGIRKYATLLYAMRAYRAYPYTIRSAMAESGKPAITTFVYHYPTPGEDVAPHDRFAMVASFPDLGELDGLLPTLMEEYGDALAKETDPVIQPGNAILSLLTSTSGPILDPNALSDNIALILKRHKAVIQEKGIKRITIGVVGTIGGDPTYFTFKVPVRGTLETDATIARLEKDWYRTLAPTFEDVPIAEEKVYRNIEPPLSFLIDFDLLKNFHLERVPSINPRIYLYHAIEKGKEPMDKDTDRRFFVRSMVQRATVDEQTGRFTDLDSIFEESMGDLEVAIAEREGKPGGAPTWNEIYLNIIPQLELSQEDITLYLSELIREHKDRLNALKVTRVEIKFTVLRQEDTGSRKEKQDYRMIIHNFPKTRIKIEVFSENTLAKNNTQMTSMDDPTRVESLIPYQPMDNIEKRRRKAHEMETTFAYDWPELFQEALEHQFSREKIPTGTRRFVTQRELYLNGERQLVEDTLGLRPIGANINPKDPSLDNGTVAFRLNLKTPQYPAGREIILAIVNDVSANVSVGRKESALYTAAARLAIDERIPFITVQANTGARFGIEHQVAQRFKIAYSLKDPAKGYTDPSNVQFDYLYLTPKDYEALGNQVICKLVRVNGETRYQITDIPGITESIDADSLRGSGEIAGVSDEAYDKIFTASLVSGYMSTGIGSYLARLLHRVIQNGPMILTGYKALNKLLNAQKYVNNEQTSGKKIMTANGVAHWGIEHDTQGVELLLRILSFVPKDTKSLPPIQETTDPVTRSLNLPGEDDLQKDRYFYARELFDQGSFAPTTDTFMEAYGKTVIAGRGRIGGRAVGFVMPNYNKASLGREVPADPGEDTSSAHTEGQAVNVLYPDSSYKMAEAIENFSREGLSTMIMIDWRGFSGGTRDMFNEVLKFGSMIVSAIRKVRQPVYVYFMPKGQLRGGAWVVFDQAINGEHRVKMYAADSAKGGVLEPHASAEFHHKKTSPAKLKELLREVPELKDLYERLAKAKTDEPQLVSELETRIKKLEKEYSLILEPMMMAAYTQAVDAQQTATVLKARDLIQDIVPWSDVRKTFAPLIERDYEVLDLEREIRALYPTITPRVLAGLLQTYTAHLEGNPNRFYREEVSVLIEAFHERVAPTFASMESDEDKAVQFLREQYLGLAATFVAKGFLDARQGEDLKNKFKAAWALGLKNEAAFIHELERACIRDPKKREEIIRQVREMKGAKYAREAFEASPVVALEAYRAAYLRGVAYAGAEADTEVEDAFTTLLAKGAAFLTDVPAKMDQYLEIVGIVKEMGLWRDADSDEDNPLFYDAYGCKYCVRCEKVGELRITLVDGSREKIVEHWHMLLEMPGVLSVLGAYRTVVLNGTEVTHTFDVMKPDTPVTALFDSGVAISTTPGHTRIGGVSISRGLSPVRGVRVVADKGNTGGTKASGGLKIGDSVGDGAAQALVYGGAHLVEGNTALAVQADLDLEDDAANTKGDAKKDKPWSHHPDGSVRLRWVGSGRGVALGRTAKVLNLVGK